MKQVSPILIGVGAVVVAALLWALDGTFLRPSLYTLPTPLVVFLEHFLGFLLLIPLFLRYFGDLKVITKKQWITIFWVALFGGALGTTFFTKALFLTGFKDISVVLILQKLQPIFVMILAALFLHERFPRSFYVYAAIALFGGYLVSFPDPATVRSLTSTTWAIAGFSLLAAFAWGSATAFGKYSLKNINYGLVAALRFGLTVLIMVVPAFSYKSVVPAITGAQWATFAIIVCTSGAAAMYLYYFGLKKIPASLATLCELAWPVAAIFLDYGFNHTVLSFTQYLGAGILMYAVFRVTKLNRLYTIAGVVKMGQNQGEQVGARTANLDVELAQHMPKGLYTAQVILDRDVYRGLLYYGYNSISNTDCLEVHLLNFSGDIYGKKISVTTDQFLRLPKKFDSVEKLSKRIQKDLALAEKV